MRQKTQPPASSWASAFSTYSVRHPAHSRSSMSDHIGVQPGDELVHRHPTLGLLAPPLVDADGAGGDIVIADNEHVRDLLELRLADAATELVRRVHLEPLRQLEVDLDRRELPRTADRVTRLHGDLRSVERTAALVEHEVEVEPGRRLAQRLRGLLPLLVGADRLALRLGRELEVEVGEAVVA